MMASCAINNHQQLCAHHGIPCPSEEKNRFIIFSDLIPHLCNVPGAFSASLEGCSANLCMPRLFTTQVKYIAVRR